MPKEAQDPIWEHWDSDTGASQFHKREITLFKIEGAGEDTTTYRHDYPLHKLHWTHKPPIDHLGREVPPFGHSTSHRDAYLEWPFSANLPTKREAPLKHPAKLACVTEQRAAFKQPQIPMPKIREKSVPFKPKDATLGTTTMRADYLEWPVQDRPGKSQPNAPKEYNFAGNTTTRAAFLWPKELPPPPAAKKNPPHVVPPFEGNTTHRNDYVLVPLPMGLPANIGLQVATRPYKVGGVGGQFELMIKQGVPAPCVASTTFTTVVDGQIAASIVIVAKRSDAPTGVILGMFSMDGIKPGPTGVPKIDVTLKLSDEKTLAAQAVYRNGNKTRLLTFQAKNGPPLRQVSNATEVPSSF